MVKVVGPYKQGPFFLSVKRRPALEERWTGGMARFYSFLQARLKTRLFLELPVECIVHTSARRKKLRR